MLFHNGGYAKPLQWPDAMAIRWSSVINTGLPTLAFDRAGEHPWTVGGQAMDDEQEGALGTGAPQCARPSHPGSWTRSKRF